MIVHAMAAVEARLLLIGVRATIHGVGRRSLMLMFGVVSSALLVARHGAADPPSPNRQVITISDEGGWGRPSAYLVAYRREVERARRALTACHELALAEDPKTAAQVDALIHIGPNGEVTSVSLDARGAGAALALTCFKRALVRLSFDAPGATGVTLRVALVLGEPPAATRPPLPFRVDAEPAMLTLGPIPMRLGAITPPPAFRAVRMGTRAVESCAAANHPASAIVMDVHLLAAESGQVTSLQATSDAKDAAPVVRCAMKAVWPEPHGRLARVDLRLSVAPSGEVSVAP